MINNQDDEKILDSITKEEIETIIKNMSRKDIEECKRKINQCIEKAPDLCYPFFISLRL